MAAQVRPLEAEDAEAAFAVIAARDRADLGFVDYTLGDVHNDLRRPDVDAWVALIDGEILAWAAADAQGAIMAVHPDHEGRGLGSALREVVEEWMRRRGLPLLRQTVWASNERGRRALAEAGYRPAHAYRILEVDLDAVPGPEETPGLRPLRRPEDEGPAHALMNLSFREIEGSGDQPFDDWLVESLDREDAVDPVHLVVEDAEGLAGLLQGRAREETGFVDVVATHPRARRRGHARALLLAAFDHYRRAGYGRAGLSVHGRNEPALRLYESLGMSEVRRGERWERPA